MELRLELREHPARLLDRRTREPITDMHNNTIAAITDMLGVYLQKQQDGPFVHIGWCGAEPGRPLTIIDEDMADNPAIYDAIVQFVASKVGAPGGVAVSRQPTYIGPEEDDE